MKNTLHGLSPDEEIFLVNLFWQVAARHTQVRQSVPTMQYIEGYVHAWAGDYPVVTAQWQSNDSSNQVF